MKIIKTKGKIIGITELSESAREIHIKMRDELDIVAGCFINIFLEIDGKKLRRAYSISSDPKEKINITLSIRKNNSGTVSPIFWKNDIIGTEFEIMGPLGLNTADKISHTKLFLVGFGIGVSVIKSILHNALVNNKVEEIHILTGSSNEKEVLYKELFTRDFHKKIKSVKHVISNPFNEKYHYFGFIQNHISQYNFSDSDIYICGMEQACEDLTKNIQSRGFKNMTFFIEGFH